MDDVDRLYQCFKCGVSPPQSALRERKKSQEKLNKVSRSKGEGSLHGQFSSPGSPRQRQGSTTVLQLCTEQRDTTKITSVKFTRRKPLSPVVFYGSPHGVPAKRPTRMLQLLHEIRDDLNDEDKLSSRKDFWVTFPKQDQAMSFAKKYPHTRLFSYQDHLNGQRRFLVSTYKEFWRRYKNMDSRVRHHYEVIPEGLPCHLYFDLEFNKNVNAEKNGDEMVDILISVIFDVLFEKYSIQGNEDWIVELDSSTEEKFSRHLIIRVPKAAFKDNSHAGAFVAEVCSRIYIAQDSNHQFDKLFVSKDSSSLESQRQLFVDTAVYSRNRCFRLALSSKAGKSSVLLPTKRFRCKNVGEEEMIMDAFICKMDGDCQKLLICKMDLDCVKKLHFDSEVNYNYGHQFNAPRLACHTSTADAGTTYFIGKSPFPALDVFVESVASVGNVQGKIRSWYWFSEYGLMVYSMSGNRYCERIGRQHKSNNVMYIVDFKRAVCYQKCYDPDCKGYRSPFHHLPLDITPDTTSFFNLAQPENIGVGNDEIGHQSDQNSNDQGITDSCKKDSWWLDAIKIADDIESGIKSLDHSKVQASEQIMDDDEDYEWWTVVEKTASQAEQEANNLHLL